MEIFIRTEVLALHVLSTLLRDAHLVAVEPDRQGRQEVKEFRKYQVPVAIGEKSIAMVC